MTEQHSMANTDRYRLPLTFRNALIVAILYAIIFGGILKFSGVSYADITDSAENFRKAVITPLLFGGIFLTVVALYAGWWKEVWRDKYKLQGHRWVLLIPALILLLPVVTLSGADFGARGASFIALMALGGVLVGYSEELLFRGMVLQGARGSGYKEGKVLFLVMLTFGLFHGLNFFLGQALAPTIQQVFFAFVFGGLFYMVFRSTGLLVVAMFLHGLWDFSTFVVGDAKPTAARAAIGFLVQATLVVTFLAALRLIKVKQTEREHIEQ